MYADGYDPGERENNTEERIENCYNNVVAYQTGSSKQREGLVIKFIKSLVGSNYGRKYNY